MMSSRKSGPPKKLENEKFINPYHFVPIGKECKRKEGYLQRKSKGKYTGWIDITLTNLSPIFIPNSSSKDVFNHKEGGSSYDFFSYTDLKDVKNPNPPSNPVIPGSELKGIIRTVYETLTDSCFLSVNQDILSRRYIKVDNIKHGVVKIEGNKWKLYECEIEKIPLRTAAATYAGKKHGDRIEDKANPGREIYLFKGEDPPQGRRNYYKFIVKDKKGVELTKEEKENLNKVVEDYRNKSKNVKLAKGEHGGYKNANKNVYLVFYRIINDKKYFSLAQIGREAYYNKVIDILKRNGGFQPCTNKDKLCEACLLFGFVAEGKKNESAASRVRFTDLQYADSKEPEFYNPLYLKELASPKPEAVEFYLKRPTIDADYWTYDYALTSRRNKNGKPIQDYLKNYKPQLLGRKFYWHNINCTEQWFKEKDDKISERNVMIRPLKKGHSFKGKIYFEKLTEEELKRLLWILSFGDNKEYAHKIGMGKPYGLGSVQIEIENVWIRKLKLENNQVKYIIEKTEIDYRNLTNEDFGCSKETFNSLLEICNIKPKKEPIDYPRNKGEEEIFKWFAENRNGFGSRFKPKIIQDLTKSPISKPQLCRYLPKNKSSNASPNQQNRKNRKKKKR